MKTFLLFVVVLAVAVGALGYWRGWFVSSEGSVQVDAAKFKQDKEALSKSVGEKAKAIKTQVGHLWEKSEGMADKDKAEVRTQLAELNKKHDRLEQQLKELDEAGQERFDSIREDLSKNLDDVEKKIKELTKRVNKNE